MYTLAGLANEQTGWGVRDETWSAAEMLATYGEPTWFRLGDRDLATHIVRTARLRDGERLTTITEQLASRLNIVARILPMTDAVVRTRIRTPDGWLAFQEYFVERHHADEVLEISYEGMEDAFPTPEVLDAIEGAELIVIAPSNPYLSVAPVLALNGVAQALLRSPAKVVAISPIVGGEALRGPAAQIMRSLGGNPSAAGIAEHYSTTHPGLVDVLVIDTGDLADEKEIAATGMEPRTAAIVIPDVGARRALARELLKLA